MKKLLILLLLSTSFSTFADSHVSIVRLFEMDKMDFTLSDFCYLQPNVQDRNGVYYFPNEEVGITATSVCVYKDAFSQYSSKGELINGKKDGKWTTWYENGQKKEEGKFKDDKRDGKWTNWEWNGQKSVEANYKDGNGILTIYEYQDNGLISKEANYKDDYGLYFGSYLSEFYKKHGKETLWYKNGQIRQETNYKDNKLDGKSTLWYKNGQIRHELNYKDEKLDGKQTVWHENGQKKTEKNYKDGVCISGDC